MIVKGIIVAGEDEVIDPTIWVQISSRHRMVARLPPGVTGEQALRRAHEAVGHPPPAPSIRGDSAVDQYLRVYAPMEDKRQLSEKKWAEYRKAGGGSAGIAQFRQAMNALKVSRGVQ